MIASTLAFVDEHRDVQTARSLLSDAKLHNEAIEEMCGSSMWDGLLAQRYGNNLKNVQGKELDSVLGCVNTHMRFLDTIPVANATRSSSFDPKDLLFRKMTIFLILPPQYRRSHAGLNRLWVGICCGLLSSKGCRNVRFTGCLTNMLPLATWSASTIFWLSEGDITYLSVLPAIDGTAQALLPEGQDQSFLSNVSQIFFGVQDQMTAEYVSNRLGEHTQIVDSGGHRAGGSSQDSSSGQGNNSSHGASWNTSYNWQQAGRKLLKPEEVVALDRDLAITLTPGVPPILTRLIRYYEGPPPTGRMHPVRMVAETVSVLLCAFMLAFLFTAYFFPQTGGQMKETRQFFEQLKENLSPTRF